MKKILKIKKVKSVPLYTKNKHVRKGDSVKVIAGDNKGLVTKVSKVIGGVFVMLADVSIVKTRKTKDGKFEDVKLHKKIHISNVMNYDVNSQQASRIGFKQEDSKKKRFFKKSNTLFSDYVKVVKENNSEDNESTTKDAEDMESEVKEIILNNEKDNDRD